MQVVLYNGHKTVVKCIRIIVIWIKIFWVVDMNIILVNWVGWLFLDMIDDFLRIEHTC